MVHNAASVLAFPVTYQLASSVLICSAFRKEKRRKGDKNNENEMEFVAGNRCIDGERRCGVWTKSSDRQCSVLVPDNRGRAGRGAIRHQSGRRSNQVTEPRDAQSLVPRNR